MFMTVNCQPNLDNDYFKSDIQWLKVTYLVTFTTYLFSCLYKIPRFVVEKLHLLTLITCKNLASMLHFQLILSLY